MVMGFLLLWLAAVEPLPLPKGVSLPSDAELYDWYVSRLTYAHEPEAKSWKVEGPGGAPVEIRLRAIHSRAECESKWAELSILGPDAKPTVVWIGMLWEPFINWSADAVHLIAESHGCETNPGRGAEKTNGSAKFRWDPVNSRWNFAGGTLIDGREVLRERWKAEVVRHRVWKAELASRRARTIAFLLMSLLLYPVFAVLTRQVRQMRWLHAVAGLWVGGSLGAIGGVLNGRSGLDQLVGAVGLGILVCGGAGAATFFIVGSKLGRPRVVLAIVYLAILIPLYAGWAIIV